MVPNLKDVKQIVDIWSESKRVIQNLSTQIKAEKKMLFFSQWIDMSPEN